MTISDNSYTRYGILDIRYTRNGINQIWDIPDKKYTKTLDIPNTRYTRKSSSATKEKTHGGKIWHFKHKKAITSWGWAVPSSGQPACQVEVAQVK